ncbi:hypothetical protein CBS101457_004690 [Exobasidium rhododendri]|nr:hypothetical protein CBS101457_004690 [Exobasidium rhododendri]
MWSSSALRVWRPAIREGRILRDVSAGASTSASPLIRRISTTATSREEENSPSSFDLPSSSSSSSSSSSNRLTHPFTSFNPRKSLKKAEPFVLHVQSTRNNTIITLTTPQGTPVSHVSTGMLGFKKSARSGYEAGHQTAMKMITAIEQNRVKWRCASLHIIFNGFGTGREAVFRALLTQEGANVRNLVQKLSDDTRIKVGGVRPKKIRML